MSEKIKERVLGAFVTGFFVIATFLTTAYFASFETKASAESKYHSLDRKLTAITCYLDPKDCLKRFMK